MHKLNSLSFTVLRLEVAEAFPFFEAAAAFRLTRAADSRGSSLVLNAEQVVDTNRRRICPSETVVALRIPSVVSVWRRSFAKACQVARINKRSRIISLCGDGSKPSKTGIAHYTIDQPSFITEISFLPEAGLQSLVQPFFSYPMHSYKIFEWCPGQMLVLVGI